MISFSCPHCTRAMNVQEVLAGKTLNCPGCRAPIQVPPASFDPQPFGPPVYAPQPKSIQGMAIGAMVCGIIGLLTFCICGIGVIPALIAVVLGAVALSQAKKPEYSREGAGMALTGVICGSLSLLLGIGLVVLWGFSVPWAAKQAKQDMDRAMREMEEQQRKRQEEAKKWEAELESPDSIRSGRLEYAEEQVTVRCTLLRGFASVRSEGDVTVALFSHDSPSIDLPTSARIFEETFPVYAGEFERDGNDWVWTRAVTLPRKPEGKYLTAKLTFDPANKSGRSIPALVCETDPIRLR